MAEILISIWVLVILGGALCAFRLYRFSKFMQTEIESIGHMRRIGQRDITYPDVMASYDNLKWYDMFNYNFRSLIVYDRAY